MKIKTLLIALTLTINANASDLILTNKSLVLKQNPSGDVNLPQLETRKVKYDLRLYEQKNHENKISKITFANYYFSSSFLKKLLAKNDYQYREVKFVSSGNEASFSLEQTPTSGIISSDNNFELTIKNENQDEYFYRFTEKPASVLQQKNNYLDNKIKNLLVKTNKIKLQDGESIVIEVSDFGERRVYILTPTIYF